MVHSWDIFDTLIARECIEPSGVFEEVERRSGFNGFHNLRIRAERDSNGTFDDIYRNLPQHLKDLELQVEMEQLFLIKSNADLVSDDDILVSDMYLPESIIRELLRHVGFTKDLPIYVTYCGKYNGWIWDCIRNDGYRVTHHTGDNRHSDVDIPRHYGIQTEHYTESCPTDDERYLIEQGHVGLGGTLRRLRLQSDDYRWHEQCRINIPILYLASIHLHSLVVEKRIDTILFATRDGSHWHRIYRKMYPKDNAHYFDSSRNMFYAANQHYIDYVDSLVKDLDRTMYVDLHGSGRSPYYFFKKNYGRVPHIYMLTLITNHQVCDRITGLKMSNDHRVEILNYDKIGTLQGYSGSGPIRDALEYNLADIEPYHECVDLFLRLFRYEDESVDLDTIRHFIMLSTNPSPFQITHMVNHGASLVNISHGLRGMLYYLLQTCYRHKRILG